MYGFAQIHVYMRILVPLSKIPKYRIPLMELMLKYGSSKMVSCSTGRKPVHVKLGETIPEPCKNKPASLASLLPGGPGNCLFLFRTHLKSSKINKVIGVLNQTV